ncbi:MAG TPA: pyridoxamine 5'-phosphate oxidase family protein, partial [Candidatus Binatia bacterium]
MADFTPMNIARAREFLAKNHWGILATRRKNGNLQMSPVTVGLDSEGRAIISSRETAFKVNNLRRDSRAALCAITTTFHGEGWVQI